MSRLQAIAASSQAKEALTTTSLLANIEGQLAQNPELARLRWLCTDNLKSDLASDWQEPLVASDTLAFLQYTSGSTGMPKGVMVSHGNLLHNLALIHQCFQDTPDSLGVSWLPPYHDMGLVGGILQPLYVGASMLLMSPLAFLQKPFRWLEVISRYKATTSGGPNFAYDLCVSKITPEQRATLDLSSWEVAFTGAEPVRAETLERFAVTFEPCGFRREAFYPCYGMAETTLIVSGKSAAVLPVLKTVQKDALKANQVVSVCRDDGTRTLVGCGQTLLNQQIVIAHPETMTRCGGNEVGEIWVSGPSVAQGYWNRPEETEQIFNAYLANTGEGPFLRTGDLGFLQDGELFVTGRLKDVIIIRGCNHYPQDIELTVEKSHPALRPSCGAACSVDVEGEERLIVVQEVERSFLRNLALDEVVGAIRKAVSEQHELQVYAVLLLKTGGIPKTSSGKIQRHNCKASFIAKSLPVVGASILDRADDLDDDSVEGNNSRIQETSSVTTQAQSQLLLELELRDSFARLLGITPSQLNLQQPLITLGLDSLQAVEIKNYIKTKFGLVLPIEAFIEDISITQLATRILSQETSPQSIESMPKSTVQTLAFPPSLKNLQGTPSPTQPQNPVAKQNMQFSLFYFSSNGAEFTADKYRLLIEGAKFADQNGFAAVWTPERHFHAFGGLYPNSSVLGAALAMVTERVRIRAGSVVLPLHNPIRVAEEWSVVDNLSQGRVDLAFARGWNPNDFVLSPETYANSNEVMFSSIEQVQKLWRGETILLPNGIGKETEIKIYPLPKQRDLPIWITCSGGKERFIEAGASGFNILTALLFQSLEELAEKIALYRESRVKNGYEPETGHVTLMLHTFVGEDMGIVHNKVREPFTEYLKSSVNLWRQGAKSLDDLSEKEQKELLAYAFERYFQTSTLFGTPDTCLQMVAHLKEIGVDEIASLIDFGVDFDSVMAALYSLKKLKEFAKTAEETKEERNFNGTISQHYDFISKGSNAKKWHEHKNIDIKTSSCSTARQLTVATSNDQSSLSEIARSTNWIVNHNAKPDARLRLFCFPYLGGKPCVFQQWSDGLPPDIEVYAVDIPKNFEQLVPLLENLTPVLLPYLNSPFAFYGHSQGALIAFELSRKIRQEYSLSPVHLFVGAQHAPQLPFPYPSIAELTKSELLKFVKDVTLIELSESFVENDKLMARVLKPFKAGFLLQSKNYTYLEKESLSCHISVFGGIQDQVLTEDHLSAWREHTNSAFNLQMLPGNHLFLHSDQELLLHAISQQLMSLLTSSQQ